MLTIKSFTISKGCDIYKNSEKQSEFISIKFDSDSDIMSEQAIIEQFKAHKIVEEALVFNTLASGMISIEIAKDKLEQINARYEGVMKVLQEKYGTIKPVDFLETPCAIEPSDDV